MKLQFDTKKKKWIELPDNSEEGIYLDGYLKKKLDFVRKIIKKGWDCPILIDGSERSGKSTLAMTMGYYLSDTKLGINNFASGMKDATKKIKELPDKSILIIDEGSLVFSSKDAMNKGQKQLMKILDVVGQKNFIIIICLPSFFDLNKQIAVRRSRFLLHVYKNKEWKRGRFVYFGEKKKRILYEMGKKNFGSYAKPKCNFRGTFPDFKPEFYNDYIKLKNKSMLEALDMGEERFNPERHLTKIIGDFKENCPEVTNKTLAKGFCISLRSVYLRLKHYKEL